MSETKVTCPVCGAEFKIQEKTEMVCGIAIGKDSNLGEIHPELAEAPTSSKAQQRLDALAKAGIDTSGLFAVKGANGGLLLRMQDGTPTVVNDDPVFSQIIESGTVPERRLFRRWVMSQMFHLLRVHGIEDRNGFLNTLKWKGYDYQWEMTVEEFRVQTKLAERDPENFEGRNRWFNKNTAVCMCNDYMLKLQKYIQSLKHKRSDDLGSYKTIHGVRYRDTDIRRDIISPLNRAIRGVERASTPQQLYEAIAKFNKLKVKLSRKTLFSTQWVDAYKGSGAYYTLKNMIMFHGCGIIADSGAKLNRNKSLEALEAVTQQYENAGWRLFAFMKKTIADNGIDIDAKIQEWRKK